MAGPGRVYKYFSGLRTELVNEGNIFVLREIHKIGRRRTREGLKEQYKLGRKEKDKD